jgi:capsid protein
MSRHQTSIPEAFAAMKAETSQTYELARTASQPGKKLSLTGSVGADADYHIQSQNDYLRMIAFVRMMERNDPIISSAKRRLRDNVNVGQMTPNPLTDSKDLNEHLKGKWLEYASNKDKFDAMGRFNFEAAADISYVRVIFDGDILPVPEGDSGMIMHLEAHRCQTPHFSKVNRGACGVLTDEKGRPDTYFLTRGSIGYGRVVRVQDVEPVKAYNRDGWPNVFHCYQPDRFSLSRGITSLAPCGTVANRRDDLEFAHILQAQISSCITLVEEMTDAALVKWLSEHGMMPDQPLQDTFASKDDAGYELRTAALHPGRVLQPRPGYSLKVNPSTQVNSGMMQLNDTLIEYLAMCLDLPSIVLRLDAKNANFSQFRNVLDQARATYGKHQRWFSSMYHAPIYRNWIRCNVQKDKMLRDYVVKEKVLSLHDSMILRHEWNSIGWKYPHPVDDANGDLITLSNSMQDLERYARSRYGISAEEHVKRVIAGNELAIVSAIEAAERVATKTGRKVDWQYFYPLPNRNGLNVQLVDQPDEPQPVTGVAP